MSKAGDELEQEIRKYFKMREAVQEIIKSGKFTYTHIDHNCVEILWTPTPDEFAKFRERFKDVLRVND